MLSARLINVLSVLAVSFAGDLRESISKRALKPKQLHRLNRVHIGSLLPDALRPVSHCRARAHREDADKSEQSGTCSAEDKVGCSWFGLVYGLPVLLARVPPALDELLPSLTRWLVEDREAEWRKLPENPAWHEDERGQLTAKFRYYNALRDILTARSRPPDVKSAASLFKDMLVTRLAELIRCFPFAVAEMEPASERQRWEAAMLHVDNMSSHPSGPFPVGMHVESWMNAHRSSERQERELRMHKHDFGWHGYLLLNSEPSNTSYNLPPMEKLDGSFEQVLFSFNNSNGVLVLLCGGTYHAVPQVHGFGGSTPRVSVPFDFVYSTRKNGMTVTHPALNGLDAAGNPRTGNVQRLDESDAWMELLSPAALAQLLDGNPAVAFDFQAMHARYEAPHFSSNVRHKWGGLVQLAELV